MTPKRLVHAQSMWFSFSDDSRPHARCRGGRATNTCASLPGRDPTTDWVCSRLLHAAPLYRRLYPQRLRLQHLLRVLRSAGEIPSRSWFLAGMVAQHGDYATGDTPGSGVAGSRGPTAYFPPGFPYFLAAVDLLDGHTSGHKAAIPAERMALALLGTVSVGLLGLVALEVAGGLWIEVENRAAEPAQGTAHGREPTSAWAVASRRHSRSRRSAGRQMQACRTRVTAYRSVSSFP